MGVMISLLSILYLFKFKLFWIFIIIISLFALIDLINFWGIRKLLSNNNKNFQFVVNLLFWLTSFVAYCLVFWAFYIHKWQKDAYELVRIYNNSGMLISFYLAKSSLVFFIFIQFIINILYHSSKKLEKIDKKIQKRVILKIGIFFSFLIFILLSFGMAYGRFSYHVTKNEFCFYELPKSFDGFKIVQISDLHLGSFPKHEKQIEKIVFIINEQKPDMIIFTGDMVNSVSNEMLAIY